MQLLRQAVEEGYNTAQHAALMSTDPDLDPLRSRADFQELMASLPPPPAAPDAASNAAPDASPEAALESNPDADNSDAPPHDAPAAAPPSQ